MSAVYAERAPTREDFAALLDESYGETMPSKARSSRARSSRIEKDVAVIDIGLKTEGRVALKEFTGPGREGAPKVGDEVEVYLERVENALGEAVISRDKARREESWVKLEKAFEKQREGRRHHLQPGQGRLHGRPRRRRGVPAALARSTSARCATSRR